MKEQLALLPEYLTAHLQLALAALLVGICISLPAGILVSRRKRLEQPVLLAASVIQTIPSLALLALMVPVLASLHLPSIGYLPAFIALVLYSVLPILSNTVSGLAALDSAVIEAASAVGMTGREQLLRVELPLALPVIVGGIRTAMAWIVGMATLSTPVGGVSLGNYIFSGLQTRNSAAVIVGCVAAALLALVLDTLARLLLAGIERRRRGLAWTSLAGFALLYSYAASSFAVDALGAPSRPIVFGAKTFTEQYILSEILAQKTRGATSAAVEVRASLGSTVLFDALRSGQIDAYVDYSGTIWANIMHRSGGKHDREQVIVEARRFLHDQYGIELLGRLGFENAYALAMRASQARELGIRRIGDLAPHAPRLAIGGDYEFFSRPEWKAIVDTYGLHFQNQRSMDPALMYQAIGQGSVDVISAFSSDGRIAALDLSVLEDDRAAIPPYDAILLLGKRLSEHEPQIRQALMSLLDHIDANAMRHMNLLVDEQHQSPQTVAHSFLEHLPKPH